MSKLCYTAIIGELLKSLKMGKIIVSEEAYDEMMDELKKPAQPNEKLLQAAKRYKENFPKVTLDNEDFDQIVEALENPSEPTERLKRVTKDLKDN